MRKGVGIVIAAGVALGVSAALADHEGGRQFVRGCVAPAQAADVLLEREPVSSGGFERVALAATTTVRRPRPLGDRDRDAPPRFTSRVNLAVGSKVDSPGRGTLPAPTT